MPNEWTYYLRALAYLKLNQPEPAETDLQQVTSIAQAAAKKDPIDHQNNFNLALYHLAAAHPEESDRLYTSHLTAPIKHLDEATTDLHDFLHLLLIVPKPNWSNNGSKGRDSWRGFANAAT
jgi:hypothetical protein